MKYPIFTLLSMIFLHIVDDYYLQGILASLKQKKYWKENAPQDLYKYDYIVALFMHSFSWSFMIMLPIFIYVSFNLDFNMIIFFIVNLLIHAYIDNLKANKFKINLIIDQLCHLIQILVTFTFYLFYL